MDFEIGSADTPHEETLTGGGSGNIILGAKASYRSFIIRYTLNRDSDYEEGILRIYHDGTNAYILRDEQDTGDCGVIFTANISGDDVRLGYTVTAGNDVTLNYIISKIRI